MFRLILTAAFAFLNVTSAMAEPAYYGAETPALPAALTMQLTAEPPLWAGQTSRVTARLMRMGDNTPVTYAELQERHTSKFHLLVIDPTLTDYQHIHPQPGATPGEYVFNFIPRLNGGYRAWADVALAASGQQQYVMASLGEPLTGGALGQRRPSLQSSIDGIMFQLSFDQEPSVGRASTGRLRISQNGQPFAGLEPVRGAFAHIVGFAEDLSGVVHAHPMGVEPTSPDQRGGPELQFHLEPAQPGLVKLFAQMRIDGRDVYAPFTILVGRPDPRPDRNAPTPRRGFN